MRRLLFIILLLYSVGMSAQEIHQIRDSVRIYFQQGKNDLDFSILGNRAALNRITDSLSTSYADSTYRLQKVQVIGSASPEGSISFNKLLSEKRAKVLFDYLSRYGSFPDFLKNSEFLGRDWNGLIQLVERDDNVPYKEETLTLLKTIALQVENGVVKDNGQLERIKRLRGGEPYQYMYKYLFPELRASRLYLWYDKVWNPVKATPVLKADLLPLHVDTVIVHDTVYISQCPPCRPFYMRSEEHTSELQSPS